MPSLKDTKRRIASVKNTQKITRAMKLVSSAKYAKANKMIVNASPYLEAFQQTVARVGSVESSKDLQHPLMCVRKEKKVLLILISSDRGLCGGLNSNLFKKAESFLAQQGAAGVDCKLMLWGKRAKLFGQKYAPDVVDAQERVLEQDLFVFAKQRSEILMRDFKAEAFDAVYMLYSHFKNALTQTPTEMKVLPIAVPEFGEEAATVSVDMVTEPSSQALLGYLLERKMVLDMYHALLSAQTSEHAARMTAMDSATQNAEEVIRSLTLMYNRARQAAITKELIEITSGAEAL
ncbi:MAG: ATP synthase F1 subunit gamma [Zetaproteobacteria bacterium]|nr:ATP synthase F1 subunit gamma [Zetaproteobacteria bacterium]